MGFKIEIISSSSFHIGARDYHLYVDKKIFTNSIIENNGTQNYISFFITRGEYSALPNKTNARLSYGTSENDVQLNLSKDIRMIKDLEALFCTI